MPVNQRAILQFTKDGTFVKEFESVAEGARSAGTHSSAIALCCRGQLKQTGGFVWKYKDEKPLPDDTPTVPPSEEFMHYLGGFFDGDGSALIAKAELTPMIGFQQIESGKHVLDLIQDTLAKACPECRLTTVRVATLETSNRCKKYSLMYCSRAAVAVAKLLLKYAIAKRPQLEILANLPVAGTSLRLTEEQLRKREEAFHMIDIHHGHAQFSVCQKHSHILEAFQAQYNGYMFHQKVRSNLLWNSTKSMDVLKVLERHCVYKKPQIRFFTHPHDLSNIEVAIQLKLLKGSKRPLKRSVGIKANGLPEGIKILMSRKKTHQVGYTARGKFGSKEFRSLGHRSMDECLRLATEYVTEQKETWCQAFEAAKLRLQESSESSSASEHAKQINLGTESSA